MSAHSNVSKLQQSKKTVAENLQNNEITDVDQLVDLLDEYENDIVGHISELEENFMDRSESPMNGYMNGFGGP